MLLQHNDVTRHTNLLPVKDTTRYFFLAWCQLVPVNEMLLILMGLDHPACM